jgi:cytochrome c oxidase subunit 2
MRSLRALAGLAVLAVATAACAGEYPQSSIAPSSDFAQTIHNVYVDIFWWSMGILTVVWVALAYILIKYRERPDSPEPKQIHGHLGLEIAWTIVPALIVVAIAIPTIQAVFSTQEGDPENALVVDVIGHQYWWEFRYPDQEVVTANELHLPVDRPVSLRIWSADVMHSFWVPMLGGKRDANPIRLRPEGTDTKYNWIHLVADSTGTYWGQCAEFCGESHAIMGMRVMVHEEEDFQEFLSAWKGESTPAGEAPEPFDTQGGTSGATAAAVDGEESAALTSASFASTAALQAEASGEAAGAQQDAPQRVRESESMESGDPLVEEGRQLFHANTCVACHAIEGTNAQGAIAPNLTLFGRRESLGAGWLENNQENLVQWIRAPHEVKPGVLMPGVDQAGGNWPATNLTPDQVEAVAAYLLSLK